MKLVTIVIAAATTLIPIEAWADCDAQTGKQVYNKCVACHALEPGVHLMGPSLHGLFGRTAGDLEGFVYSGAMTNASFIWDQQTFGLFMEDPMQYLPGTTMPFAGIRKPEQREALGCYLAGLDDID